jgi:hypothetical protein
MLENGHHAGLMTSTLFQHLPKKEMMLMSHHMQESVLTVCSRGVYKHALNVDLCKTLQNIQKLKRVLTRHTANISESLFKPAVFSKVLTSAQAVK